MLRRVTICAGIVAMTLVGTYAQTPDGETPSEETGCDGYEGRAFGLCNAYCEAMDCDSLDPKASWQACDRVYESFERATQEEPPCYLQGVVEADPESECPCNFNVQFWTEPTLETPILQTEGLIACDPADSSINSCFTCRVAMWSFDRTTFLSKVVGLWEGGTRIKKDDLYFLATEPWPEPPLAGECFAQGSVNSEIFYATFNPSTQQEGELLVTDTQFPVCLSDLTALQEAFLALCPQ